MSKQTYQESANGVPPGDDDGHGARMGIFEHLAELRDRLFKSFVAVILGTLVGLVVADPVLGFMQQPFCDLVADPADCQLNVLGPVDPVIAYVRVSLLVGGILAVPYVTYQLLMFILPALTMREKRLVYLSIPAITMLFIVGILFAWYVLVPPALSFLNSFLQNRVDTEWTIDLYFSFVIALVFWMGVAFETPLVFFTLSLLGVVGAKTLIENWRLAIVGAAVAAAIITPTIDPVNMFLVMAPLMVLYVLSILLVFIGSRINRNQLSKAS